MPDHVVHDVGTGDLAPSDLAAGEAPDPGPPDHDGHTFTVDAPIDPEFLAAIEAAPPIEAADPPKRCNCGEVDLAGEPAVTLGDRAVHSAKGCYDVVPVPAEIQMTDMPPAPISEGDIIVGRRCVCGEYELFGDGTIEIAGMKHRSDGPCFACDTFGEPLISEGKTGTAPDVDPAERHVPTAVPVVAPDGNLLSIDPASAPLKIREGGEVYRP